MGKPDTHSHVGFGMIFWKRSEREPTNQFYIFAKKQIIWFFFLSTFSRIGELGKVSFDENGDIYGKYLVKQLRNKRFDTVAVWSQQSESFERFDEDVYWGNVGLETADEIALGVVESVCSKPCQIGLFIYAAGLTKSVTDGRT